MTKKGSTPVRGLMVLALVAVTAIASSVLPASAGPGQKFLRKNNYMKGEGIFATYKDAAQDPPGVGPMGSGPLSLDSLGTMATLNLPAGSYAISAKAWVQKQQGDPAHVHCALVAGTQTDHSRTQSGEFDASLALEVVNTFGGPGSATLECADDGSGRLDLNAATVQQIKIVAVRAPSLTNGASA